MMDLRTKVETILRVIKHGETPELIRAIGKRLYSDDISVVLRRDLSAPLVQPVAAKIPIKIRPMQSSDIPYIIAERPRRLPVIRDNIPTCYVATTEEDLICYMQWMFTYDQQDRIRPHFMGELMVYHSDTVLLEFAYTFERFRGLGIMSEAMARISEIGLEHQARWAITYVEIDNIASIKGCARAGFQPYIVRTEKYRGIKLKPASFRILDRQLGERGSDQSQLKEG